MSADQADPQGIGALAFHAHGILDQSRSLNMAAHRTGGVTPFHQAAGVEGVIAQYGQHSIHALVHALQAHWTGG